MIVTLTTDLGTKDTTVAACKAQLMAAAPAARVVDIAHGVPRHDATRAAYLLGSAYRAFPGGTIHLVTVGALSGKANHKLLYCHYDAHHFLAPDNGVLPAALPGNENIEWRVCKDYDRAPQFMDWVGAVSAVCKQIADDRSVLYPVCEPVTNPDLLQPQKSHIGIACKPLCSDRYENIVLNIKERRFRELVEDRPFSIRTFRGGNITEVSTHYNDVSVGKPLCRFNSSGYLEIAVNHGSALELFGIDPADSTALAYHTVRISLQ